MIVRKLSAIIAAQSRQYPVVTVFGPRQAGKTTAVQNVFPTHRYVNLEDRETRDMANLDPKAFIQAHPPPVILAP